jgi:glycosyltransferase involved in cell wall biosynthesis
MKILHITPSCYPATFFGGPIFTVYALNGALVKIPGVALKLLTTDTAGPGLDRRLERSGLGELYPRQEVLMMRRIAGVSVSLELLRKLPSLVRWADVVHLTAIYSFPTLPTLLVCRLLGKPVVWSPHGAVQDAYGWEGTRRRLLKRLWEMACNALLPAGRTVLHVVSVRERGPTQARIPRARTVIVPNGVEIPAELPTREWRTDGTLRLMYLGRLSPKKGIENLLQSIALLRDPGVVLTVYGSGEAAYAASLHELAGQLGLLDGKVSFAGQVDGAAREAAFGTADVCIIPSHTECFCMVVAEALARGVPVIASHGTPWERLENEGCGLWVDNSPQALVRAIDSIGSMDLAAMGKRGREWMRREFSWDVLAADMMRVYRSLAAGKE